MSIGSPSGISGRNAGRSGRTRTNRIADGTFHHLPVLKLKGESKVKDYDVIICVLKNDSYDSRELEERLYEVQKKMAEEAD